MWRQPVKMKDYKVNVMVHVGKKIYFKGFQTHHLETLTKLSDTLARSIRELIIKSEKERKEGQMIQITRVKITHIVFDAQDDGTVKIAGSYSLISEKGDIMAKSEFNGYNTVKFDFDPYMGKNVISDAEGQAELQLRIQNAVKAIKQRPPVAQEEEAL